MATFLLRDGERQCRLMISDLEHGARTSGTIHVISATLSAALLRRRNSVIASSSMDSVAAAPGDGGGD